MGTERIEVYRCPCSCGNGSYTVSKCSPDHQNAHDGQTWVEPLINCPDCDKEFALVARRSEICRVPRSELKAKADAQAAREKKIQELERYADASGHYVALVDWLLSFRSAAAAYRALEGIRPPSGSEAAFRSHRNPAKMKNWVRRNIHYFWLAAALDRIGRFDPKIQSLLQEEKDLANQQSALTVIEIICKMN